MNSPTPTAVHPWLLQFAAGEQQAVADLFHSAIRCRCNRAPDCLIWVSLKAKYGQAAPRLTNTDRQLLRRVIDAIGDHHDAALSFAALLLKEHAQRPGSSTNDRTVRRPYTPMRGAR